MQIYFLDDDPTNTSDTCFLTFICWRLETEEYFKVIENAVDDRVQGGLVRIEEIKDEID